MRVSTVNETNLIRVALELPNKDEAVAIVRAVVDSYVVRVVNDSRKINRTQTDSYDEQLKKIGKDIDTRKGELK